MPTLSINVSADDLAYMEQIAAMAPLATRHLVARAAMRAGLQQMARDRTYAMDRLTMEVGKRRSSKAAPKPSDSEETPEDLGIPPGANVAPNPFI